MSELDANPGEGPNVSTVRRYLIALVVLGGLAMPASAAAAAVQTFHRFEAGPVPPTTP